MRSLALLRANGWVADCVEQRQGPITRDFLGAFDIIGFRSPGQAIVVQTTSASNMAKRVAKVRACPHLGQLLAAGVLVEVHGWQHEATEPRVERLGDA